MKELELKIRSAIKEETDATAYLNEEWENKLTTKILLAVKDSIPVDLPVGGDFCGDCKRTIYDDEDKYTAGTSSEYGVYYEANSKPICGHCINVRFEKAVKEFESKNPR